MEPTDEVMSSIFEYQGPTISARSIGDILANKFVHLEFCDLLGLSFQM